MPGGAVGRGCPQPLAGLLLLTGQCGGAAKVCLQEHLDQGSSPGLSACRCVTLTSGLTSLGLSLSLENEGKQ